MLALAGIAAAVLLFLVPGFITGRRNDEGIAWSAPKGERVVLAEAGFAITSSSHDGTITARDLDTGARRWRRTDLGKEHFASGLLVRRVGGTLLVVDRAGAGCAGSTSRPASSAGPRRPRATGTRDPGDREPGARRLAPLRRGTLRGGGPVDRGRLRPLARAESITSPWLGSPPIAQSLDADRSLWPASAVIVRTPPEGKRYEVRRLDTGKVLARGDAEDEALAVIGNLFLREDEGRVLSATDVTLGRAGLEARRRRPVARRPAPRTGRSSGSGSPTAA